MPKFRKKPVVIEAYNPYNGIMPDWFKEALSNKRIMELISGGFDIETLEGTMRANVGDWIIQGINGELYPCKPNIFEKTYEEVEE